MVATAPFKLSVQLEGHNADVRDVAAVEAPNSSEDSLLLSASRDGTARVWLRPPGSKNKRDMACQYILEGQDGFVNSCCWLREADGSLIAVAGGQDSMINAYRILPSSSSSSGTASLTPDFTLLGHESNVCALDVRTGPHGYIVSGSWDKTARVWRDWECVAILPGHDQAVWAVLALDDDLVLTASADKLVRLFSISQAVKAGDKAKPVATFTGSTDAVRGLVRLDGGKFASCGNDGTINVYPILDVATAQGQGAMQPLQTLSGHTSFVYSLSMLGTGELISSGEDRSVRIWREGRLHQTITIPAISVWSVVALANGDLACGSSDGFVRIYTRVPQRTADEDVLQAYDAAVSSQSLNKAQVGDVQKENIPGPEALAQPGKEGQVKMVRNGELVEAHQYSAAAGGWQKIGEVVGGVGNTQKKLYEGQEYDYVFDVDIADGVPPLKLPYNASQNPYVAAQRFLEKNELPMGHLDQVVQFIEKNTNGVQLGGGEEYRDPYTGASSYRPNGSTASARTPSYGTTNAFGTASSTAAAPSAASATSLLPHTAPLTFRQFNVAGAKAKIAELDGQIPADMALTVEEKDMLDGLVTALAQSSFQVDKAQIDQLCSIIERWPLPQRFPLVDVLRMASLSASTSRTGIVQFALNSARWLTTWPQDAQETKSLITLALLALRTVANALSASAVTVDEAERCLAYLADGHHHDALSKPGRVAYATVLLNASIVLHRKDARGASGTEHGLAKRLSSMLQETFEAGLAASDPDGEAIYRATMALGNLLVSTAAGSLEVGRVQTVQRTVQGLVKAHSEPRLEQVWHEIQQKCASLA